MKCWAYCGADDLVEKANRSADPGKVFDEFLGLSLVAGNTLALRITVSDGAVKPFVLKTAVAENGLVVETYFGLWAKGDPAKVIKMMGEYLVVRPTGAHLHLCEVELEIVSKYS